MSVKRTATSDLNHDNWDQDDPSEREEMGTFKAASKDVIEKRVMRTAKRRFHGSTDEAKKSAFSNFGGFNKAQPSSFDFLANLTNVSKSTNGTGNTKSDSATSSSLFSVKTSAPGSGFDLNSTKPSASQPTSLFGTTPKMEIPTMTFSSSKADSTMSDSPFKMPGVTKSADISIKCTEPVSSNVFGALAANSNLTKSTLPAFKTTTSTTTAQNTAPISVSNSKTDTDIQTDVEKARNKYYSKLKGLNESVSSWIMKHVEKTPLCFLTPIFKDYENYLKEILGEYEAAKKDIEVSKQEMEAKPMYGFNNQPPVPAKSQDNPTETLDITNTSTNNTSNSGAFGTSLSPSKATPTIPSASAKGFSFGVTPATSTNPLFTPKEKPSTLPSQGFSYGAKSTPATDPVSPPSKGFSFGITPASPSSTNVAVTASNSSVSPPSKGFSFGTTSSPTTTNTALTPSSKGFSFGAAASAGSPTNTSSPFSSDTTTSPAGGLFRMPSTPASSTNTAAVSPFSFGMGGAKPFSFNSQQSNTDTKNDEDEDQPPKVEYIPLVEENSVYDKKCKIFVKLNGNFVDKGVSTLYIKKIENSGKHQLLVRANTSLGTILLNLILSSAVPTQRMGKNNVMLVCIPTPDAKGPPTPVLIRVKTGEEADDLLEILNKYKS